MADAEYESILLVKNEVFVYRIPPRTSNRGYKAADWKLDNPDWTGRMRVVAKGKDLSIKLEDKNSGELFAKCPVEEYPSIAVEPVMDSSRYFVLMIKDEHGRSAFIGIGFQDRADSFDLNVSIQDHFKWLKQEAEAEKNANSLQSGPKLDLGFKEGQTITLNIGSKKEGGKARPRAKAGGAIGLLPPPPGGVKIAPPSSANQQPAPVAQQPAPVAQQPAPPTNQGAASNVDCLFDLGDSGSAPIPAAAPVPQKASGDLWGDFTSANASQNQNNSNSNAFGGDGGDWVQF